MPDMAALTFQILVYAADIAFDFWPIILAAPLGSRKTKGDRLLPAMFAAWVLVGALRLLTLFATEPVPSFLIPEPLSTTLFLLTGVFLLTLLILFAVRRKRQFAQKTGAVQQIEDLLALTPTEFEDMVVTLYQAAGHQAKRTGAVGDHGVDVVVKARNGGKWVVQCKRWRGSVGEPIVRDFYGTMQHAKADRGILISTGKFTRPAQAWAKGKPLSLYDGSQFLHLWHKAQAHQKKKEAVQTPPPSIQNG